MKKQIKTKLSRILCTALALCMIAALIPAAFATTTEEAKEFSIDFKSSTTLDNCIECDKAGSDPSNLAPARKGYGLQIKTEGDKQYYAIKFTALASGKYNITYKYYQAVSGDKPNGGVGNVLLLGPGEDLTTAISSGTNKYFENIEYGATAEYYLTAPETPVCEFEKDKEYTIAFVATGTVSGGTSYRQYPTSLTFTPQGEPGITINYNIGGIITDNKDANRNENKVTPFAFADLFNYEKTNGFFDFVTASYPNTNDSTRLCCNYNFIQFGNENDKEDKHIVFELNVPKKDIYSMKVDTRAGATAPVRVYLSQDTTDYMNENNLIGTYTGSATASTVDLLAEDGTVWEKELDAGKYSIAFVGKQNSEGKIGSLGNLYLYTGGGEGADPVYMGALVKADKTVMNINDTANLEVIAYMSDGNPADTTVEWKSDNEAVAKVEDGVVTAIGSGVANVSATVTYNGVSDTITKVITVNDPDLTDAFDDAVTVDAPSDYIAPTVDSIDATGIVGTPVLQADGSYKITAPETAEGKGEFLYWKKAMTTNEKIVSLVREFNYVPESEGRNILVAVYEGDVTSTEEKCYNANGQYLPDATPVKEDLPSMAGYGKAYEWKQYKDTNVYVAQYKAETPIADIDVTVKGDNTSGGGTNLAYGAPVTCKATGANFKCWKKTYGDGTAKIVSTDAEYTFNAWEDCEVEAVYQADVYYTGSKLKIIIDSFTAGDETGVMAEFLGLGNNVVEKGIMFNDNRIAMTTVGNQFSVIADKPGTYEGYVIVKEIDGLKLITDGSYTKSAN